MLQFLSCFSSTFFWFHDRESRERWTVGHLNPECREDTRGRKQSNVLRFIRWHSWWQGQLTVCTCFVCYQIRIFVHAKCLLSTYYMLLNDSENVNQAPKLIFWQRSTDCMKTTFSSLSPVNNTCISSARRINLVWQATEPHCGWLGASSLKLLLAQTNPVNSKGIGSWSVLWCQNCFQRPSYVASPLKQIDSRQTLLT